MQKVEIIKQHLNNRIQELKKIDYDYCELRWDMSLPQFERDLYRGLSNEVTFARQELERINKQIDSLFNDNKIIKTPIQPLERGIEIVKCTENQSVNILNQFIQPIPYKMLFNPFRITTKTEFEKQHDLEAKAQAHKYKKEQQTFAKLRSQRKKKK